MNLIMNKLTKITLTALLLSFTTCANKPIEELAETTIFMVRHAEKKSGKDPELNDMGKKRALALSHLSDDYKFSAILASKYRRTIETATPLANKTGLLIYNEIAPNHYDEIVNFIKKNHLGKTVFIVGHSNTIPGLANTFLGENRFKLIDEKDFTKLFKVTLKGTKTRGKVYTQKINSNGTLSFHPLID